MKSGHKYHNNKRITIQFDDAIGFPKGVLGDAFVVTEVFFGNIPNFEHHELVVPTVHRVGFVLSTYNFHFYLNIKPVES